LEKKLALLLDLNVLLDVAQRREPFYETSAAVLTMAFEGSIQAFVPAHVFTTFYYIVRRSSGKATAERIIDRLLARLEVAPSGIAELRRARNLAMTDFEDAVIACGAEAAGCAWIITRNVEDFSGSPVCAMTPAQFLIYAAEEPLMTRSWEE
jgi:predicted nucleic acid-binding protein